MDREQDQATEAASPPDSRVALQRWLPVLAAVLVPVGLALLWLGWREWAADRLAAAVVEQRQALVVELQAVQQRDLELFKLNLASEPVRDALRQQDYAAAAAVVSGQWGAALGVEFHPADLGPLLAQEPGTLRFGRLALLQAALMHEQPAVAVFKPGGGDAELAIAGRVMDDNQILALGLVRLPLESLLEPLRRLTPAGAFAGIKQGRNLIAGAGDSQLAYLAEAGAVSVPGTPWRVVASAPFQLELPVPGVVLLGLGVALVLAAGLALWQFRRGPGGEPSTAEAVVPTLAQVLEEAPPAPAPKSAAPKPPPVAIERSIFRAYDIRGIVGQTLDESVAKLIGQAVATVMHAQGLKEVVVGRDGRHSGPALSGALIEGLRASGRDVIDIGQAPTPLVYFAGFHLRTGSGVAVTGSHNPPGYNGFKVVVGGETLAGDAVMDLYARIAEGRLHQAEAPGTLRRAAIEQDYIDRIASDIQVERKLKVVVDCGNGVAGGLAPQVLEAIGCEPVPLYCEVDGSFPHHHPDPSEPANLTDLIRMVQRMEADLGLAFDGDGDRLGVVTRQGEIIYPDRVLMLFAQDVLTRNPGACILYDVKCTGHLAGHILRHGGSPVMWKTGHSLMKAKMKETEAELAGEMSGHFFFRERWYGFDDAIYAAARLLEILASRPEPPEAVFATLPKGVSTPELKLPMAEGEHHAYIERFRQHAQFGDARVATIDGVRADWPDGWGLVRASNTTPSLILRFDADTVEALKRIQAVFREQMLALDAALKLPF